MVQATTVSPFALLLSSLAYFSGNLDQMQQPHVEVETAQGRIRGIKNVARNGRMYMEFLGIPYAQPPVGDLRWEPPQPPSSWTGTREATAYGRSCLQYEFMTHFRTGAEDCLNLNVYTTEVLEAAEAPTSRRRRRLFGSLFAPFRQIQQYEPKAGSRSSRSPPPLKPVIVYLHGGLFMSGFPYIYRPKYLMEQDVVLVTLNYRVNSFGFLNTGDGVVRGNMGLKDQTMALRWVQKNIARFGGDPSKVTLMGQSAGGASVAYHLLSPLSTGLFHRAISQSGTTLNSWAYSPDPVAQAKRLAKYLRCPTENSKDMVRCMKGKSALEIERFHKEYLDPVPDQSTIFAPSVEAVNDEGTFLSAPPRELLERGEIANRVPWIVGVTNGEGHFCALYLMKTVQRFQEFANDMQGHLPHFLNYENNRDKNTISQRIFDRYFNFTTKAWHEVLQDSGLREKLLAQMSHLFSDTTFFNPVHDSIRFSAPHMPVYPYVFTFEGEGGIATIQRGMAGTGMFPRIMEFGTSLQQKWLTERIFDRPDDHIDEDVKKFGVAHADDLVYQFNIPAIADEITPGSKYYDFSHDFIKLWLSFAENGKPSTFKNAIWVQASRDPKQNQKLEYFDIGRNPRMISEPFSKSVEFWNSLGIGATTAKV